MAHIDRRTLIVSGCALSVGAVAFAWAARRERERILGGACEGCDWVYEGMPAELSSTARIAPRGEPGVPMVLDGILTTPAGTPAANVIVYAYHTDRTGIYPAAANRHGRIKGWALTDARGHYRFESIRPGAYPGREIPQHVHMHVIERGIGTYYIDELRFEDDPLIHAGNRRTDERGGNGLVMPQRRDGVWHVRRDIVLGRNVPGYPPSPVA